MSPIAFNQAPFPLKGRKALLLAEGDFSTFGAKTAVCYLRYRTDDVVAVVDSTRSGETVGDVVGFAGDIPVVASVAEGLVHRPDLAVVGIAPRGGQLDNNIRDQVLECAGAGLDIVSGLHTFLEDDVDVAAAARQNGVQLWDVRRVSEVDIIGSGRGCTTGARCVLVVGSDCNVGKMTATLELYNEAATRGMRAAWAATGQTGIMLRERGVAVDRVVSDFVGGVAESLVNHEGEGSDIVFVEGQGSIVHPGYAGVALGLMFGVMPDCMVLAHSAERTVVGDSDVEMPSLVTLVELHEAVMAPLKKTPVVAIALNTSGTTEAQSRNLTTAVREQTGLPAGDPVRGGTPEILGAVTGYLGL